MMFEKFKEKCIFCDKTYFKLLMNIKDKEYFFNECKKALLQYNSTKLYTYSNEDLRKSLNEKRSVATIRHNNYVLKKQKEFIQTLNSINFINPYISEVKTKRKYLKDIPYHSFCKIRKNMPINKLENFIVLDTETTGLTASKDELLEITMIKFINNNPTEAISSLLKPKKTIPTEITNITNITNEMVKNSPKIEYVANSFSDFIKGFNLVGYNLDFDLKFLHINGIELFNEKRQFFDALDVCKQYFSKGTVENYKLDTIAPVCGIYRTNAHRSTEDALSTGIIFRDIGHKLQKGERM